jgi:anti-sigma regulatory factor (Ser/Thr protein kinase)
MSVDPRGTEPGLELRPVLDQRFDADDLYQVRAAVGAHAAELGLRTELAHDVVIAVHELASNSVRHGPGHGRLRIWAAPQTLICEVADGDAPPADTPPIAEATPAAPDLPWPTEPGHGLWLVSKVADILAIHRSGNGTTVIVKFDLQSIPGSSALARSE